MLARGKEKPNGDPGDPSMAEAVMLELRDQHPIVQQLLNRAGLMKTGQFLASYQECLDDRSRIHTTFKVAGTVTGRTSSGKEDDEKFSGRADPRGINLQQVPRDPFIRGLFGAAPGYVFVEADFSQVELRIVAFISRDRTMLRLYQSGQDIHRATAAWVLGVPESSIGKEDRKKAKAVNFGFAYGMGADKFVHTAYEKYDVVFTLDQARAIRKQFFRQFSGLLPWHARQRRLVHEYARVQSPIGRVRNLPDIRSDDPKVQAEAERQAINAPVQGFGSDMMLLSMNLIAEQFKAERIKAHVVGTVHDAGLFEVKRKDVRRALPIIKGTMENLPLKRKFGINLDVPIIADLKVGTHWGDATELTPEQVWDWKGEGLA